MQTRKVLRGAIVGCGNVALHGHLPVWQQRRDFKIIAAVETNPQQRRRAQTALPGVRMYEHIDALLADATLDFVDIATPPTAHVPAILAAAQAGIHILCEKPLTTSLEEYQATQAAIQHAGVVLHTVHNWQYSEAFHTVQHLLATETIGAVREITFDTARNGYAASPGAWRVRAAVAGGGILVDHGWHALYLLMMLAQERPSRIQARLTQERYTDVDVEDTAHCRLDFPSLQAHLRLTWAAEERRTRWHLRGTAGELLVDDDHILISTPTIERRLTLRTPLSAGSHHPEWFGGVIDAFACALRDPSQRSANQEDAAWCVMLLNLAYASNRHGGQVLPISSPILSPDRRAQVS